MDLVRENDEDSVVLMRCCGCSFQHAIDSLRGCAQQFALFYSQGSDPEFLRRANECVAYAKDLEEVINFLRETAETARIRVITYPHEKKES